MATYYGMCRSNYFKVKDPEVFRNYCLVLGVTYFDGCRSEDNDKVKNAGEITCGFYNGSDGIPACASLEDELLDDYLVVLDKINPEKAKEIRDDIKKEGKDGYTYEFEFEDFSDDIANMLEDEWVAIVMEIGNEAMRYLVGSAVAINSKGETQWVGIDNIYAKAKTMGKHFTRAEY